MRPTRRQIRRAKKEREQDKWNQPRNSGVSHFGD